MYQEYPKALYNGGAYVAVRSKVEESERRAEGFLDWREDYDRTAAAQEDEDEVEEQELPKIPAAVVVSSANAPKIDRAPLTLKK